MSNTFDCYWGFAGSNSTLTEAAALETAFRNSSIYTANPSTNTPLSVLSVATANPYLIINENLVGGFPGFNQSGGGPDGPLSAAAYSVANVFDKLMTLGISSTAVSISDSPNLVQIGSTGKYRMPQQGLAWMASYNYYASEAAKVGHGSFTATHFIEDIFNPMLDYLLDSMPGVDGWYNLANGGALSLPSTWTGIIDYDCESWLPYMPLPADIPAPSSSSFYGYNNIPAGGIYNHYQYFILWCMSANFSVAAKRLPASHYANCPNPAPLTTYQECFDLYWNLVQQLLQAFQAKTHAKCANARFQMYNVPVDLGYYDSAYYDWLVPTYITQAQAETFKTAAIDQYKRMYSDPLVVTAMSYVDDFAASWYVNGYTSDRGIADAGAPGVAYWSYALRQSMYTQKAIFMRWFNSEGPGRNKPSRVYLQAVADYNNPSATNNVDANSYQILSEAIRQAQFTGAINWGYFPTGTTASHTAGIRLMNKMLEDIRDPKPSVTPIIRVPSQPSRFRNSRR